MKKILIMLVIGAVLLQSCSLFTTEVTVKSLGGELLYSQNWRDQLGVGNSKYVDSILNSCKNGDTVLFQDLSNVFNKLISVKKYNDSFIHTQDTVLPNGLITQKFLYTNPVIGIMMENYYSSYKAVVHKN